MILQARSFRFAISLAAAAWFFAVTAVAQEPAKDDEKNARSIREQDVYIPYEKLQQVFEKHGRGVFLPYEKFQELWQAAQDKTRPAVEPKPPIGVLITDIDNDATVKKDVVHVKAKLQIEVLAEGWSELPLRLSDAAITSATVGGKPARLLGAPGQDYRMLIEKKGKQPESIELLLEYAKAITRSPGQNSVAFQTPQAPVSRWRVTIPQAGVKVNIQPLIAATEVPVEKNPAGAEPTQKSEETVVLAFVGAAPTVRIDWTPKAEGATGLAAMASVQTEQQVWISEGVARTRTMLAYAISRAELNQLVIDVPADQKVVNVFDANVRLWSVSAVEGRQRIVAELFESAKTAQKVTVELEKFTGEKGSGSIEVPVVKVAGVGQVRQQGVVVVQVSEGLRAEAVKASGLLQVDAGELPAALRNGKWAFAYRYATADYQLALNVEQVKPQIIVDSLVDAYLEPERLSLDLAAIYTIEKAGVFRLDLDIPAGYDVRKVYGATAEGATPAQVDAHHLEGENKTRLVVNLSKKAMGRVALAVQLQKDLTQPELRTPTGKAADIALPIPTVVSTTVERATGRLLIHAPESLRVNPGKTVGLRSVSFQEAEEGIPSLRADKPDELRPVLAYAFTQEPIELTVAAERRKPQVTVRQLLVTRVEEGVVKYQISFFYNVLYSGVKSLRIDVPSDVAATLRTTTPGVHEAKLDPQPADLLENHVAWGLTGESEFMGDGQIELAYERKIEKLAVGKSVDLLVPYLKPRDVDRAWGQIVLVKSETIDVYPSSGELTSLRPIDPQHDLMNPVASAARAFEFHDDWSLTIVAMRYELEEVKHTSIERALVRMVVTPSESISVQSLYRIRSAEQRLAVRLPEGAAFDAQPLHINGRPVVLEMGGLDEYFVPLLGTNADTAFMLELRYTFNGDVRRLDLPSFPQEPAVVKAYLCAYLPETRTLLGVRGPWTEEFAWRFTPGRWEPSPRTDAGQLVRWVSEGVAQPGAVPQDFPTDGRLYVYSTLSPAAGPDGALQMVTIPQLWLQAIVFAATLLLGLLLLPARLPTRTVAVGAALIALVLAGVFLPTFTMQVLNAALFLAILIVAIFWTMVWAARWRTRRLAVEQSIPPQSQPSQSQPSQTGETAPPHGCEQAAPSTVQEGGTSNG